MSQFSVIIPALNEEASIQACVQRVRKLDTSLEIIVVDGGSQDQTAKIATSTGAWVIQTDSGRGTQCNAGANLAAGDILLFLHADTRLPEQAFSVLEQAFEDPTVQVGTFRLAFDDPHWLLKVYAHFSRYDTILTRFGDQGITVRKNFFLKSGGFPDWPLFEDLAFLRLARRQTRIVSFPATVMTSSRRYRKYGIVRQQVRNLWYIILFLSGVSPRHIALKYNALNKK
jgi:rSAM/selenodomain-associated transferase 2